MNVRKTMHIISSRLRFSRIVLFTAVFAALQLLVLAAPGRSTFAAQDARTNPDTGFGVRIEDNASLLQSGEETELIEHMYPVTQYGHAAFVTTTDAGGVSTTSFAKDCYQNLYGSESGALFVIDMDNRYVYLYCKGEVYKIISKSYANTITDNVFRYARSGAYGECAIHAFDQVSAKLAGEKIARPMKHITNLLLAIVLAMGLCYFIIRKTGRSKAPKRKEVLEMLAITGAGLTNPVIRGAGSTRTYSPRKSSSGGGGGFRGGGGRGGGGGGGHSF